jgi:hypothetical protein
MQRIWSTVSGVPGLLLLIFIGVGVIDVLDETLSRMHKPGGVSASASTIASPFSVLANNNAQQVVAAWKEWPGPGSGQTHVMGVTWIVIVYVVATILFIAVPITRLLIRAIGFARGRFDNLPNEKRPKEDALTSLLDGSKKMAWIYLACQFVGGVLLILATAPISNGLLLGGLGLVAIFKSVLLIGTLIALAVGLVGSDRMRQRVKDGLPLEMHRDRIRWIIVLALRVQLCVAAFLLVFACLGGDLGHELDDAFLYPFGGNRFGMAVKTAATAIILVAVLTVTASVCLREYLRPKPTGRWSLTALYTQMGLGLCAAAVGAMAWWKSWPVGLVALVPGVLLFLVAFFGQWPRTMRDIEDDDPENPNPHSSELKEAGSLVGQELPMLAVAAAATPLAVLTALAMRNGVRLLTVCQWAYGIELVVVFPLLAALVGWLVIAGVGRLSRWLVWQRTEASGSTGLQRWWLPVLFIAALVLFVIFAWSAQLSGTWLGPWGVVFAFCLTMLLAGSAAVLAGNGMPNWSFLAVAGFRRVPLILALVVCVMATTVLDNSLRYHDTRLSNALGKTKQTTLTEALNKWAAVNSESPASGKPVPLVFVASAGGGIRAAYWTALVLGCVLTGDTTYERPGGLPPDAVTCEKSRMSPKNIFLASGISGGSLGLAMTRAVPDRNDWWKALRFDFLAPTIAAMTFRDIPNAFLRVRVSGQDDASALETAWENAAQANHGDLSKGMMASAFDGSGDPVFPLLLLNGTSVADGCRVAVSPVDFAGGDDTATDCLAVGQQRFSAKGAVLPALAGTKNAFDNTCTATSPEPHDLRLSTAALLSARFPYVSPTGTLFLCNDLDHRRTFDLDGGLIDSSAGGPLALAWSDVVNWLNSQHSSVCYQPKLIIIDNGYQSETQSQPASRPNEMTAPITAEGAVNGSATASAREAAALAFQKSFEGVSCGTGAHSDATARGGGNWQSPNVVDFYPVAKPGIEAPLGWTLSYYSQTSLENQLGSLGNQCSAQIVAEWFTADSTEPQKCIEADQQGAPQTTAAG